MVSNQVALSGRYIYVFMYSNVRICNMVVFSLYIYDVAVKAYEKLLPSADLWPVLTLLHEGEQEFIISEDHKLVYYQLSLNIV